MLAESYGNAGTPNEGLRQLEEAARLIEVTQVRMGEVDLHRVRGELLISVGDPTGAEAAFQQAIAVAHRQNAKFWELRATTSLARLWREQGKVTAARNLLAPVYGWFTEGFDTPVLIDAKTLLDALSS
jgi:predicted ATPase